MAKDDLVRLRHMLDSAREAVELIAEISATSIPTILSLAWSGSWKLSGRRLTGLPLPPGKGSSHPLVSDCQPQASADPWLRYN